MTEIENDEADGPARSGESRAGGVAEGRTPLEALSFDFVGSCGPRLCRVVVVDI